MYPTIDRSNLNCDLVKQKGLNFISDMPVRTVSKHNPLIKTRLWNIDKTQK